MAINFHKDLQNSQLHNPKDFSDAKDRSVLVKNKNSLLKWIPADYTLTVTIVCRADASKSLAGRYFYICRDDDSHKYQVWFDVDSDPGSITLTAGYTGVEVSISENDTATTVATALKVALNGVGFSAGSSTDTVTVSGINTSQNATDYSTEFTISNVQNATTDQYLTTNGTGAIEWKDQPTIPTIPSQHHYISATIAPKSSSFVNVYLTPSSTTGAGVHSNTSLNTSTGSGTLPTTILKTNVSKHNIFFMPSNVTAFKIHYSVWHTDAGTQSVDWQFFDARFDTGTGTVTLNNIASITNSVPAGEQVHGIATCSTAGSGVRGLILYGKIPSQRNFYISATISLTVT